MEIIVLGAGAIGSLFGAKLSANHDVTIIARPDHVSAINAHGLQIGGIESATIRLHAAAEIGHIGPGTLILLTTKVPDSAAALNPVATLMREDTTIVCLQNGLGSEEIARAAVGDRGIVLRGITQLGAIFKAPGAIQYMARGSTLIGRHARSALIAEVFTGAGLECRVSANIDLDIWHKLIVNCVVNPITAILGCEVRGIANRELDPLCQLVIDECVAVGATRGLSFETDFLREIKDVFRPSHNIASMLQDLRRGRPTEIDYMNGAVAAIGERHGIACPVNAALTAIIKTMEATGVAVLAP